MKALDPRLRLAVSLAEPCAAGADIGADHGLLSCCVLKEGICRRMLVADISPDALAHARALLKREGLDHQAVCAVADGLDALTEPVQTVWILGMGGRVEASILRRGANRLQGAALILSAHTELPEVRSAVMEIGYHFTREEPVESMGRFYLVWRAEPGPESLSGDELRYGTPLLTGRHDDIAAAWWRHRLAYEESRLRGLRSTAEPDVAAAAEAEARVERTARLLKEADR